MRGDSGASKECKHPVSSSGSSVYRQFKEADVFVVFLAMIKIT